MDLSIIIPTRDRRERLLATLDALDRQRLDGSQVEVLVVDNGSTEGATGRAARALGEVAVDGARRAARGRVVRAQRRPEARARPGGAPARRRHGPRRRRSGRRPHRAAPRARPGPRRTAVLGCVRWAEPVDLFMRWLETAGFQFSFEPDRGRTGRPRRLPVLVARVAAAAQALRDAGGFDAERFPYLMEDTELGIRLRRRGLAGWSTTPSWSCATTTRRR